MHSNLYKPLHRLQAGNLACLLFCRVMYLDELECSDAAAKEKTLVETYVARVHTGVEPVPCPQRLPCAPV